MTTHSKGKALEMRILLIYSYLIPPPNDCYRIKKAHRRQRAIDTDSAEGIHRGFETVFLVKLKIIVRKIKLINRLTPHPLPPRIREKTVCAGYAVFDGQHYHLHNHTKQSNILFRSCELSALVPTYYQYSFFANRYTKPQIKIFLYINHIISNLYRKYALQIFTFM